MNTANRFGHASLARLGASLAAALTMWSMACLAAAQSESTPELVASARFGLWSHSRDLDGVGPVPTASVWVRGTQRVSKESSVVGDAWLALADRLKGSSNQQSSVRELFWRSRYGDLDIRLGRQLIAWGRADAINPTDSLGVRNYTRLTPDDNDQREGSDALSVTWYPSDAYSLRTLWQPLFRGDFVPLPAQPMQGVSRLDPKRKATYGLKLDSTGAGSVDWSLSYFDGYDRMPDLGIVDIGAEGVQTSLSHHRVQTFGADLSATLEGFVLRAETAWSQRDPDKDGDAFFRKRSQLLLVLGGDKNIGDFGNVNLQFFGQWIPSYRRPNELGDPVSVAVATLQNAINNQPAKAQYGISLRLSKSWLNETWQGEVSGLYSFTTHGHVIRASLKHAVDDRWRLNLGMERYQGADDTFFGLLRRNSNAYVELRYLF
jgi:hypothetical protein